MPDPYSSPSTAHSQNGGVIAWLNNWSEPEKLRSGHVFDGYWRGASQLAESLNYQLKEYRAGPDASLADLSKQLVDEGVAAMLIAPLQIEGITPEWEDARHWEPFCAVRLGHTSRFPAFHIVTPDQAGNTRIAFSKIQEHGYRRVGFVASQHAAQHLLFKAGFLLAQFEVDARLRVPPLVLDQHTPDQGWSVLSKWLDESGPDAILTDVPIVRTLLVAAGYRLPQEIGLAVCSVTPGKDEAGILENAEEIGRVAVLSVISQLQMRARGVPDIRRQILVEGKWADGSTLPQRG